MVKMDAAFQLDSKHPMPLHAQLSRAIRFAVLTGRLAAGHRLPTVRQMAVNLRINANTVAKVYLALEREGVVVTKRGVGTFIGEAQVPRANEKHRERQLATVTDRYLTEATSLGFTPREVARYLAQRIKEGE